MKKNVNFFQKHASVTKQHDGEIERLTVSKMLHFLFSDSLHGGKVTGISPLIAMTTVFFRTLNTSLWSIKFQN